MGRPQLAFDMLEVRNEPRSVTQGRMSEMISELAAPFISQGKTCEEKHHRLVAACSAWNIACGSPEMRRQQLEQFAEEYRHHNPAVSPSDLANVRKVMESSSGTEDETFPG